jgi:hypothetical protein
MELQQRLEDINQQLEDLVQQRKQILMKLCKYKLIKLLEIQFEINNYIYDEYEYGNREISIYISSLLLQIDITKDKNNTVYNVYYCDVEHVTLNKEDIDTPVFDLLESVLPGFKQIFVYKLDQWFF